MASGFTGSSIDLLKKRSQQANAIAKPDARILALEAAPASPEERNLSSIERLALVSRRAEMAKAKTKAEASRNAPQGHHGPAPTRNAAPHQPNYYPCMNTGNNINLYGNSTMEDPTIQYGSGNRGGTKTVHNHYVPYRMTKAAA